MSGREEIDYGPLKHLIGEWTGENGLDIAPEPDGQENNPYSETISYSAAGDVTNAEQQTLAVVHYRQIVRRISNGQVFHDQTGYWTWDSETKSVIHSFVIPRAVCVLAGGVYTGKKNEKSWIVLEVAAGVDHAEWSIIQSPFMREKALTKSFSQQLAVGGGTLTYAQTTMVDIYGKSFEHTDRSELTLS